MRTSNRRVYAIGDIVAGGLQFTHAASYHASLVIRVGAVRLSGAREQDASCPGAPLSIPRSPRSGSARRRSAETLSRQRPASSDGAMANPTAPGPNAAPTGIIKLITHKNGRILGCAILRGGRRRDDFTVTPMPSPTSMKVGSLMKFVAPLPDPERKWPSASPSSITSDASSDSPWIRRWLGIIRMLP